jgi:prepilin-type N-terminal cleavage/methylation domain-containing protein
VIDARVARQRGFTLIELMVSLVIFSFAIAGVLAVAVSMTRAYREQRLAIATENAARAPLDYIVDAVRQASPGVTSGTIKDANDCSFNGNALSFVDSETAPDELTVVYASGGVVTTTHSAFTNASTSITIPAAHLDQFATDDYVIVSNQTEGTLVKVTGVTGSALTVNPQCGGAFPTGGYASCSILVRANRAKFTIGNVDGIPSLLMYANGSNTAEPVAEGVEDLQIALGVDANDDGALAGAPDPAATGDEWTGDDAGETLPTGNIRGVHVVVVSRDTRALTGTASFYQPAQALNHGGSTTADNYRRRMLSSTVEIRNLSGSP